MIKFHSGALYRNGVLSFSRDLYPDYTFFSTSSMEKFPELKVMVYAEGRLSVFLPQQPFEVQAGITVLEVASLIGMPDNIPFAATVNQRVVDLNDCLNPGDEVHLFPQISGGKE